MHSDRTANWSQVVNSKPAEGSRASRRHQTKFRQESVLLTVLRCCDMNADRYRPTHTGEPMIKPWAWLMSLAMLGMVAACGGGDNDHVAQRPFGVAGIME